LGTAGQDADAANTATATAAPQWQNPPARRTACKKNIVVRTTIEGEVVPLYLDAEHATDPPATRCPRAVQ